MTEQEIKDKAKDVYVRCFDDGVNYPCVLEALEIAIRESAEEKIADLKANFDYVLEGKDLEIKTLGERCNQLLKDKGDLTDELAQWKEEWQEQVQKAIDEGWERTKLTGRVRELEQQIEKMKCCENCRLHCASPITIEMCTSNNYDKWEIKE